MNRLLNCIGPAIIVAAVVLGPGSILTSSKVGATFGLIGIPVVFVATILMIGMVALAARLGVVYSGSLCDELASRLGRPVTVLIGLTLFTIVALFQSSNNVALVGGFEPMLGNITLSVSMRVTLLVGFNVAIVATLYLLNDLYAFVERMMRLLIGLICLAFVINFLLVLVHPPEFTMVHNRQTLDWIPLLGMVGTTFSVAGAFYQAYLVKEKGWGIGDARKGVADSVASISLLGLITMIILFTAWRTFYGNPNGVTLTSVGDVARQLEPLFGPWAKLIFAGGILAGALSSFVVNAMIGGTVLSDALGKGARLEDRWPVHFTVLALLVGMCVAIASFAKEDSTVVLITVAQALTVLGIPAIAAALIYLGTRQELVGNRKIPSPILVLATIGFCVSIVLAGLTAYKVYVKLEGRGEPSVAHRTLEHIPESKTLTRELVSVR